MSHLSRLLSIELPDESGKTVTYYTYDGYLEENYRNRLRSEEKSYKSLTISGSAIFALIGYIVEMI